MDDTIKKYQVSNSGNSHKFNPPLNSLSCIYKHFILLGNLVKSKQPLNWLLFTSNIFNVEGNLVKSIFPESLLLFSDNIFNLENKKYKYICEKCELYTNAKSTWEKHLSSGKHQTGKRAESREILFVLKPAFKIRTALNIIASCKNKPCDGFKFVSGGWDFLKKKYIREAKYICEKCGSTLIVIGIEEPTCCC